MCVFVCAVVSEFFFYYESKFIINFFFFFLFFFFEVGGVGEMGGCNIAVPLKLILGAAISERLCNKAVPLKANPGLGLSVIGLCNTAVPLSTAISEELFTLIKVVIITNLKQKQKSA